MAICALRFYLSVGAKTPRHDYDKEKDPDAIPLAYAEEKPIAFGLVNPKALQAMVLVEERQTIAIGKAGRTRHGKAIALYFFTFPTNAPIDFGVSKEAIRSATPSMK